MIAKLKTRLTAIRDPGSLGGRAIQSGVWITGGFVLQRALQFGSNLILTRLLFPEAFGTMALATVFLVGLAMFSDIGLRPAVIRDPRGDDPDFLNTAWTLQVIRGLGLFAAGCLLAYPVSLIYGQPILFPLLMALSLTAAISGFQTIGLATAERKLDFFRPTAIAVAGQIIGIITLVTLAYYWRSVWALAAGNIIGSLATLAIGHLIIREHRHRFTFEKEAARSITNFGKWIFVSTIVTFLGGEGLRAIQAGLMTPAEFGVLSIAYTIAAIAVELPSKLTGSIGLPALSEVYRTSPERMAEVLHNFRKKVIVASLIGAAIIVFVSDPLIKILYDQRYHSAGHFVAILTISNSISIIFSGYFSTLLAMGRSHSVLKLNFLLTFLRISGSILGFYHSGTIGMIVGVGVANILLLVSFWFYLKTKLNIRILTDFLSLFVVFFLYIFSIYIYRDAQY
jgi:O-antigen/teichoic acid export membrane protein